mgnify:CR=1 FL=1
MKNFTQKFTGILALVFAMSFNISAQDGMGIPDCVESVRHAISAGLNHNVVITPDGTLNAYGSNNLNQLDIPANTTEVVEIHSGEDVSFAVKSDGSVTGWGYCGNHPTIHVVPEDAVDVVKMSVGLHHALALKSDGTVVGWGDNNWDYEKSSQDLTNVVDIEAAFYGFSFALKADGTVVGWQGGAGPNLGITELPNDLTDVVDVEAGGHFGLALKADGTVIGWGDNGAGQLNIPEGLSDVIAISAGYLHAIALKSNGTVVSWGGLAQSGSVPEGLTDVIAISCNIYHNIALQADGSIVAWGGQWSSDGGRVDVPEDFMAITNECIAVVNGCMDETAFNYDSEANTDDGSCEVLCWANDDVYLVCNDGTEFLISDDYGWGSCDDHGGRLLCPSSWPYMCSDPTNTDNMSMPGYWCQQEAEDCGFAGGLLSCDSPPMYLGCTDETAFNYASEANTDDGSCEPVIEGCMDETAFNYASEANTDDNSCGLHLPQGWSMFGYTCLESLNAVDAFSDISTNIEIVKDEWGLAYLPSYGFSAFDNLEFSEGYQIKMIEEVTNFQFCDAIIPQDGIGQADVDAAYDNGVASVDITSDNADVYAEGAASVTPEDGITQADVDAAVDAITPEDGISQSNVDAVQALLDAIIPEDGITQADVDAAVDAITPEDGISQSNVDAVQALLDAIIPEDGVTQADLDALAESYAGYTAPIDLQIGDLHAGGIVFQINENGSGLVAAMEDLPDYYNWDQANSQASSYSSEGYTGWHLPSRDELQLMYNTIGQGADNSGNFEYTWYWSSSEYHNYDYAWYVSFHSDSGNAYTNGKHNTYRVRVIRAF